MRSPVCNIGLPVVSKSAVYAGKMLIALVLALAFATACIAEDEVGFVWNDEPDDRVELRWNGRPAAVYEKPLLDKSSTDARQATCKPYHHLYSPNGQTLLTKGPGGSIPDGRGLFFGFSKINYGDGKSCDLWHCAGEAYQDGIGRSWLIGTGPKDRPKKVHPDEDVSQCEYVEWHGQNGEVFGLEQRIFGMSRDVHHGVEGWEIDLTCHLETTDGKPIHLDGAPQSSGLHFCVSEEVAKKADLTYYLRADGKGKPGERRSWNSASPTSPESTECEYRPWIAVCFVVGDKRYTVLYMEHPANPKPSRYTEYDYGCFGSSIVAKVTEDEPLDVSYRLWIQEGVMTVEQCKAIQRAYVPDVKKEIDDDPFGIFKLSPE